MKQRTQRLLVAGLATALLALGGAGQALALGTDAGTVIVNTASVGFTVSGVDFTSTGSADFTVDRKILPVVAKVSACGNVYSGNTTPQQIELQYTLTNQGNSTEFFRLSLVNEGGDQFDVAAVAFRDASGGPLAGNDVTTLQLTEDASQTIYVTVEIPVGYLNTNTSSFYLLATAWNNGAGAALAESGANAEDTAEVVFADGDGDATGDIAYDGKHSGTAATGALCTVTVSNPALTVNKTVAAVSDPTGSAFAIPGATVTYQIVVTNGTGGAVSGVTLSDPIPAGTTYVGESVTYNGDGTVTDAADADNVTVGGGTITVTIGNLAIGASATITFQVTIN